MWLVVILFILWLFGLIRIPGFSFPHIELFQLFDHRVTLWEVIMLIVISLAVESLPTPLRQIAYVLIVFWLLSILGILAIGGLSNIIVLAILIGLVLALFQR